ncbi:MAG: hypothetical protein IPI97_08570 [Nitrosomonas sp.]|nr:hypothetical protein [Nitrosomonas sp.]MBK7365032.1 hypothetical protein [Nitrosomonas sp.]
MKKVVYFPYTFLCALLSSCAVTPSISVLGAYFPDWLFCIVGALVMTSLIHAVLRSSGRFAHLEFRNLPLAYAALACVLALSIWLIFFKN